MKNLTTTRNKFISYVIAIFLAVSFYSFEFFNDFSESYLNALKYHKNAKKERTKALNAVKEYSKGSLEYDKYLLESQKTDIAWENFIGAKKQESFLGFKSFHFFIEKFGLYLALFCYALYNLFRSFYFEKNNYGNKVLHGFIISVCMFYFFWIFQVAQDFPKVIYYLMTFGSAAVIVFAVRLITKYQEHYINQLKKKIKDITIFSIDKIQKEKREDFFNHLEKVLEKK